MIGTWSQVYIMMLFTVANFIIFPFPEKLFSIYFYQNPTISIDLCIKVSYNEGIEN